MTTAEPSCRPENPRAVALADLDGDLASRMKATGPDSPIWARMSNLIILCDTPEAAANAANQLPGLIHLHPARVLLLATTPGTGPGNLSASVQEWACPGPSGRSLNSEQVTLRADAGASARLPFLVRELVLGDLPTNLWWASRRPPALAGPILNELAEHVQQLVYDSYAWPEPARSVGATATWLARFERPRGAANWRRAADLNWRRLKYWRRLLAQALDPNAEPGAIESITEVVVEHGPHAVVQVWQLVSWMAARLGWRVQSGRMQPGAELAWQMAGRHGMVQLRLRRLPEATGEIRQVRVACQLDGKAAAIRLAVEDGRRLAATREGATGTSRTLTIQPQTVAFLVARQLSDRDHDSVFIQSMVVAQAMAQAISA